jgi:hypothetical protein
MAQHMMQDDNYEEVTVYADVRFIERCDLQSREWAVARTKPT